MYRSSPARKYGPLALLAAVQLVVVLVAPSTARQGGDQLGVAGGSAFADGTVLEDGTVLATDPVTGEHDAVPAGGASRDADTAAGGSFAKVRESAPRRLR